MEALKPGEEQVLSAYAVAAIPLAIWVCLAALRGQFWRLAAQSAVPGAVPPRRIVAVIPARDEAATIGQTVASLLGQEYPGAVHLVVVDDGSTDGTWHVAAAAARDAGAAQRLTLIRGASLPGGWTGKLWALSQGIAAAAAHDPEYLLFTDADIHHAPHSLTSLVRDAERHRLDLVSHMVRLSTATPAERLLIPAFVFFFFMLYPPAWVASQRHRMAAAAGGCVLIRPAMLDRIGGVAAIRAHIIDDCALARAVKLAGGRIWLGLARETRSLRVYGSSAEIGAMISRTAFAQLRHSYLALAATLAGLFLTYLLPVLLLFAGDVRLALAGATALLLMGLCYLPMVRFYRLAPLRCLCLPLIACFYAAAVVRSAVQYTRGSGGQWKGRVQDA